MSPSTPPEISVDFISSTSSPSTPRTPRSHRKQLKALTPSSSSIRRSRPSSAVHSSGSGRGHKRYVSIENNVLLTPEETPARNRYTDLINSSTPGSTARILFPTASSHGAGAGRAYKNQSHVAQGSTFTHALDNTSDIEPSPSTPKALVTDLPSTPGAPGAPDEMYLSKQSQYKDAVELEALSGRENLKYELDFEQDSSSQNTSTLPDDTPGIWCVFRGKKVFRPLPKDEYMDIVPRRLFPDAKGAQKDFSSNSSSSSSIENVDRQDSEEDTDVEENSRVSSREFFVYKRPISKFITKSTT